MATSTSTATKWRELNEGEKPGRGMEIRIPGDKTPLGVVVKVGPGEIKYRPHGGGALQVISASAEVEVKAAEEAGEGKEEKAETTKATKTTKVTKASKPADSESKKSKAVIAKPEQLEIVEEPEETEKVDGEDETEKDTDVATSTKPATNWMRIEELVEKSGVPLGRILKARREGAFEGMAKPDPDYDGVGRKPLIYSPAALKVAMGLTSSGKGGRPSKGSAGRPRRAGAKTTTAETSTEKPARAIPPKRHINAAAAPAQSHLYAAGESLQTTLDGINAEIERLTDLKARLEEARSFFAV